jgi:hypothetical protein
LISRAIDSLSEIARELAGALSLVYGDECTFDGCSPYPDSLDSDLELLPILIIFLLPHT